LTASARQLSRYPLRPGYEYTVLILNGPCRFAASSPRGFWPLSRTLTSGPNGAIWLLTDPCSSGVKEADKLAPAIELLTLFYNISSFCFALYFLTLTLPSERAILSIFAGRSQLVADISDCALLLTDRRPQRPAAKTTHLKRLSLLRENARNH
jgi:hypothetical protein